jgi:hypothetical protein
VVVMLAKKENDRKIKPVSEIIPIPVLKKTV